MARSAARTGGAVRRPCSRVGGSNLVSGGNVVVRSVIGSLLVAALSSLTSQASAQTPPPARRPVVSIASFAGCDGYGLATKKTDGLDSYATTVLIFRKPDEDLRRRHPRLGQGGVFACDAAIGRVAELSPDYQLRTVTLLRARALHKLALDDAKGALADLDLADTVVVPGVPAYGRSLKLSLELVRALALRYAGDQAGADAAAWRAWSARPYSRTVAMGALIAMGPSADVRKRHTITERLGQLDPSASGRLYVMDFEQGRLADALALIDDISPRVKARDLPMTDLQQFKADQVDRHLAELFWIDALGSKAYALAALGHADQAAEALAQSRRRLTDATPPPAVTDPAKAEVVRTTDGEIRQHGRLLVEGWTRLTEARLSLGARQPQTPSEADRQAAEMLRAYMVASAHSDRLDEIGDLFTLLPEPEIPPRNAKSGSPFSTGSKVKAPNTTTRAYTRVSYAEDGGALAAMEEGALFRAAALAREKGYAAFRIVARRDTERAQLDKSITGAAIAAEAMGYESRLDVEFVNPAAPPRRWRTLDAEAIHTALAPYYAKPVTGR